MQLLQLLSAHDFPEAWVSSAPEVACGSPVVVMKPII